MSGIAIIVLVIHLFVTVALIGVVLLQRSEGGALGIGGGAGSFLSAAGAGNALTRATMVLAALFFGLSILLTVLSRNTAKELQLAPQRSAPVTAPQSQLPSAPVSQPPSPAPESAASGSAPAPVTPPKP